jgi:hypothetical protein
MGAPLESNRDLRGEARQGLRRLGEREREGEREERGEKRDESLAFTMHGHGCPALCFVFVCVRAIQPSFLPTALNSPTLPPSLA